MHYERTDGRPYAVANPPISLGLTLIMAMACGLAIANLYYNQPLLEVMTLAFPGDASLIGLVPVATQLGCMVGLLLLLPLGEIVERRRLIVLQHAALAISLAAAAMAPNALALVIASAMIGLTASVGQQIVPLAAELADPRRRGAVLGTVMSGLFFGVLLARVCAGFVSDFFGWRTIFWLGAGLAVAMTLLLSAGLPRSHPDTRIGYRALLGSLIGLWRQQPQLRRATVVQACLFGSFNVLWAILALQLVPATSSGLRSLGCSGSLA